MTTRKPKLGPDNNFTMYIYIYMHAVKLLAGPSLAFFKVIDWSKSNLLTGPRSLSVFDFLCFKFKFCKFSFLGLQKTL